MLSCDATDYGCGGGYLDRAWTYLTTFGAVTETCLPYTSGNGTVSLCPANSLCADGTTTGQKYHSAVGTVVNPYTVTAIKTEIYNNGPVEAGFTVYNDFFNYKSGVYHHVSGKVAGGHAVKMIGWGVLNGVSYWLCAN